jgi:hypothetical protein
MNGLMDIQHWDASGLPVSHTENSIAINGPRNGVSYSYRVCAMDLLGTPSSQLSAPTPGVIPMDSTPPQAPGGNPPQGFVTVTTPSDLGLSSSPCSPPPPLATIVIRWNRVGLDVQGHREQGSFTKYRVYRFPNANNPTDGAAQLCEINDSPANPVPLSWSDQVPRAIYGETSYWYRVNAKTRLAT